MTFTREPIKMSGALTGGRRRVFCTVSALRVTLCGTRLFKDCQYSSMPRGPIAVLINCNQRQVVGQFEIHPALMSIS